jgi:hypothetical protein
MAGLRRPVRAETRLYWTSAVSSIERRVASIEHHAGKIAAARRDKFRSQYCATLSLPGVCIRDVLATRCSMLIRKKNATPP